MLFFIQYEGWVCVAPLPARFTARVENYQLSRMAPVKVREPRLTVDT